MFWMINGLTVGLIFNWGNRVYGKGKTKSLRQESDKINTLPEGHVSHCFASSQRKTII